MAYTNITSNLITDGYWRVARTDPTIYFRSADRSPYGFVFSAHGGTTYLVSNNRGVNTSCATAKIEFDWGANYYDGINLKINYISNGENNYDYGIFSKSGMTIASGTTAGTSVYKTCKGESSTDVKTLYYYIPNDGNDGTIYINYYKDVSTHSYLDRLYLDISAEYVSSGGGSDPYYQVGYALRYYGFAQNTSPSWLITGNNRRLLINGFPSLSSGIQSGTSGNYVWYYTSGQSSTPPAVDVVQLTVGGLGYRNSTTMANLRWSSASTASGIRFSPATTTADTKYRQDVYLKEPHVVCQAEYNGGDGVYAGALFVAKVGSIVVASAYTGSAGASFLFSSGYTANTTVEASREGSNASIYTNNVNQSTITLTYPFSEQYVNTDFSSNGKLARAEGIRKMFCDSSWNTENSIVNAQLVTAIDADCDNPPVYIEDETNINHQIKYSNIIYLQETPDYQGYSGRGVLWSGNTASYTGQTSPTANTTYSVNGKSVDDLDNTEEMSGVYTFNGDVTYTTGIIKDTRTSDWSMYKTGSVTISLPQTFDMYVNVPQGYEYVQEVTSCDLDAEIWVVSASSETEALSKSYVARALTNASDASDMMLDGLDEDPQAGGAITFTPASTTLQFNALAGKKYYLIVKATADVNFSLRTGSNASVTKQFTFRLNVLNPGDEYSITLPS